MTLIEQGRLDEARDTLTTIEPGRWHGDGSLLWRVAEIELLLAEGRGEEALAASRPRRARPTGG